MFVASEADCTFMMKALISDSSSGKRGVLHQKRGEAIFSRERERPVGFRKEQANLALQPVT